MSGVINKLYITTYTGVRKVLYNNIFITFIIKLLA